MNLQQMADAAASILKENLTTAMSETALPWGSPLRPTYERLWVSFKPDGWEPDIEANFILPSAVALARQADKLSKVQFACPDDAGVYRPGKARTGQCGGVVVVASVESGVITLATSVGVPK